MGTPGPTPETTLEAALEVFERQDEPCTPLTATEVAEELDCTRRTAHRKLEELSEQGELHSKKTGARSRIWWRSPPDRSADEPSRDGQPTDEQSTDAAVTETAAVPSVEGDQPVLEQFGAFVSAVEDYAIFMLDPDGVVVSWNEGARRIKGYEEGEIVGEHFTVFYEDTDVRRGIPANILKTAREEGRAEHEGWRVRADGSRFWANVTVTAVRDDDGSLAGFTKVTRDLTERRNYERALEEERDLLDQVLDTTPVGIMVRDADGNVTRANSGVAEILDITEEEVANHSVPDLPFFDEEGEPMSAEEHPYSEALATGERVPDRLCQIERPDGERRWLSMNAIPLTNDDGEVERVVTTGDDITELKERERQLRRERNQTEELLKTAPVSIAVQDADGETVLANRRAQQVLGLSEREIVEDTEITDDWAVTDADGTMLALDERPTARVLETGEPVYDEEIAIERPDGERIWFSINAAPVVGPEGDVDRVITTGKEITELKERTDELESELSEILGRISDAFYALDEEWRFTHVNDRAAELLQRSADELLGKSVWAEFPEAAAGEISDQYRRAMDTQESVTFETFFEPLDGWFELNAYPSETGLSVYFRDVTERKERERQLLESEQRYRTLIEHFPNGAVALVDGDLNYRTVGGTPLDVADVTVEELEGMPAEKVLPSKLADELVPRYEAALDGEFGTFELELGDRFFQFQVVPVRDDSGDVFAAMGMSQDVTERKRYERELERFRTIVETVNDGVYTVDGEGRFTMVNEAYAELTGYSREELVGSHVSLVIDDDVAASARELEGELLAGETDTAKIEAEIATADGGTVTAEATFAMLPDEEGDAERVGVVRDISERKAYERALEESERRYRTLVEHFPDGLVGLFDEDLRYTAAGGELVDKVGIDLEEAIGATVDERLPEDLLTEVEPYFRGALEGEESTFEVEYHDRHLQAHTLPVRNGNGEIFAGMLMVQDVTDRVEREREIEEQRERYRRLVDVAPVAIVTYDAGGEIQFANEATAELIGVDDTESLVGTPAIEYIHPDEREESTGRIRSMLEDRESVPPTERRIVTADGEVKHVLIASIPVTYGGEPAAQTVLVDVTERKEHERELEARARQQDVVSELGQRALENPSLADLFDEAVEAVADTLDTDYTKVLELQEDGEMLLRSGVGWREGLVGDATVGTGSDSQAGYTLDSTAPVVVDDLATESRFSGPDLLVEHDVSAGISTIIGPPGDPWGVLGTHDTDRTWFTAKDVSFVQSVANILTTAIERARYEEELNETVAELRESNQRLEQFAYIASHDLQEPLRMISNYLQLLEGRYADELDENARDFIDFAVDGAERMKEMINDLLAYSRVETEAEPLEPVDSGAAVSNALDDLRLQIEENDAEIDVGDLPTVVADRNQLEQVFQNLVSNAIKYRDDEPPRVEIDAERGDGEWVFRISDNGIGIDPAHVDRIFEVFKRLHTNEEYPGTGIGLALCEKIVERHGGRIWVESEEGEGATFWFTIPFGGQDED
ncbi:PAS domain S-box protein [Halorarum halophilum]|uniref:histidine kinase n=1 Tax=Halorarum halophilum TaxID=2743090 RepID=A0A7D5GY20_9EURY|nr:PAS domain S-box protein [Halobaculum halophilum]QLG28209.1 PAS domain S-box protein [Halobaculum halophilum]